MHKSGFQPFLTAAIAALICLVPVAAGAEGQVLGLPTEDFFLEEMDEGISQFVYHVYYSAAEKKRRNEVGGMRVGYWIFDYIAGKVFTVTPGAPARYREGSFPGDTRKYQQTGQTRSVAGHTCSVWRLETDPSYETCRTSSGVQLMNGTIGGTRRVAISVRLERQDPALFRLPEGAVRED